jgi:hypothetical protein
MFLDGNIWRFKSQNSADPINIFPNGNLGVRRVNDSGYTFDVNGTTRLDGQVTITGTTTPTSGTAKSVIVSGRLSATTNNDTLVGLDITPSYSNGSFTGVTNTDLRTNGINTVFGSSVGYGSLYGSDNDGVVQIKRSGSTTTTQMIFRPSSNAIGFNGNYWGSIQTDGYEFKINSPRYGGIGMYQSEVSNSAKFELPDVAGSTTSISNIISGSISGGRILLRTFINSPIILSGGSVGIATTSPRSVLEVSGLTTPTSGVARNTIISGILSATTNNNTLIGLDLLPTFTGVTGVTGTTTADLRIQDKIIFSGTNSPVSTFFTYISRASDQLRLGSNSSGNHIIIYPSNRTQFLQATYFASSSPTFGTGTGDRITVLTSSTASTATGIWIGSSSNSNIFKVFGNSTVGINVANVATGTTFHVSGNTLINGSLSATTAITVGQLGINGQINMVRASTGEAVGGMRTISSGVEVGGTSAFYDRITFGNGYGLIFSTFNGSSSSERMRITGGATGGNLLIGTTTDTGHRLNVFGNTLINGAFSGITTSGVNWFSGNTSTDMLRITQTGSGNAFVIEDESNPDATPFVVNNSGNVGIGTTTPNTSAQLEMSSTTQGFLPPRMTTVQRNAIPTPAEGLIVYDTTTKKHYGFDGTIWNAFY